MLQLLLQALLLWLLAVAGGGELAGHGGVHRLAHLLSTPSCVGTSQNVLTAKPIRVK